MQSFSISDYSLFWDKIFLASEIYSLFCKYRGKQNVKSMLQTPSLKQQHRLQQKLFVHLSFLFVASSLKKPFISHQSAE